MFIRVITLTFDPDEGRFRDEALREFLVDKKVLEVKESFFTCQHVPYWAVMILYQPLSEEEREDGAEKTDVDKFHFRKQLNEEQRKVFSALRDWRNEKAKSEGVPGYIVSTNEQLAEMVLKRPRTLEELGTVHGFGNSRVTKHGKEVLAIFPKEKAPEAETPKGGGLGS